ncbi:MAG: alpha/beta fold hydrolase [Lysobacterales bacterium]
MRTVLFSFSLLALYSFATGIQAADTSRVLSLDTVADKYAGEASRFVDLDGVKIHYRDEGEGPVVLLVHGTLGDLADWDGWVSTLAASNRVVRFDMPGFGLSADVPNGNHSVDRMHTLIDALMHHLQVDRFAIVGISYGGMVAFRYAATRRDRVSAMVLVNSAGIQFGRPAPRDESEKAKRPPSVNLLNSPIVTHGDVERFYQFYINDHSELPENFIQRKLDFLNVTGRAETAKATRGLYERGNPTRVLSGVLAPSLIIWGTGNYALQTDTARKFESALSNACMTELVMFDEAGHYINVEMPKKTANAALEFLPRAREACSLREPVVKQSAALLDSQFWQTSEGWWLNTNTYFDGDLDYRIREYHSLVHIRSEGPELIETEHRFYPAGDLAEFYGAGELRDGEGVEVISSTRWEVTSALSAQLISNVPLFGPQPTMHMEIVDDDVAVRRVTDPATGKERYRMLITLHGADRRNIAHYGINTDAPSGLAGFAAFRGKKIPEDTIAENRRSLRERHKVAVSVTADDRGKPVVSRLQTSLED